MKFLLAIILFLIISFTLLCQTKNISGSDDVVAKAGDIKISAREFRERFDFSPHPRTTESLDTALVKKEYLYTLLAEKLLAQKAKELKLDTTQFIQNMLTYMGRLFVRDALYKKEISSKVKVTKKEISEAKERMKKLLVTKYLYSTDINEIQRLYADLNNGIPIDSLIAVRPEAEEQKTPGTITFGTLDENVEDAVYSLKVGQFTKPIYTGNRWYIFQLEKIIDQPYFNTPDNLIKIKQTIEKRQAAALEDDYLNNFLQQFQISVDRALFTKILIQMHKYLHERQESYKKNDKPKYYYLVKEDFSRIEDSLGAEVLRANFIKYKKNPESVKQFLDQLKINGFRVDTTDYQTVARAFNNYVKNYLESELLAREGLRQNLDKESSVRNDLSLWEDYYLSQRLIKQIQDSIKISDAEAYEFYSKNHKIMFPQERFNVQEILVDSLETIQKALDDLNKHVAFETVSEKYSILDSLRERGGNLGYLPPTQSGTIGEIKKIVKNMKVGEVYGPIKLSDGFALLKLVDIQNAEDSKDTSFAQIKDELKDVIRNIEFEKKLKSYVANLALKYGVEINKNVYVSIPVFQFNTVTIRLIGFGGRIYAFPYEPLFAGWYSLYLQKKSQLPQ